MKLRDKKTGEIEYLIFNSYPVSGDIVLEYMDENAESGYSEYRRYSSLAELNADWEDYTPQEPLIKDEKIRKAVRAWADTNNIIEVCYDAVWNAFRLDDFVCSFDYDFDRHDGLVDGCHYTIAQLCGEEECSD